MSQHWLQKQYSPPQMSSNFFASQNERNYYNNNNNNNYATPHYQQQHQQPYHHHQYYHNDPQDSYANRHFNPPSLLSQSSMEQSAYNYDSSSHQGRFYGPGFFEKRHLESAPPPPASQYGYFGGLAEQQRNQTATMAEHKRVYGGEVETPGMKLMAYSSAILNDLDAAPPPPPPLLPPTNNDPIASLLSERESKIIPPLSLGFTPLPASRSNPTTSDPIALMLQKRQQQQQQQQQQVPSKVHGIPRLSDSFTPQRHAPQYDQLQRQEQQLTNVKRIPRLSANFIPAGASNSAATQLSSFHQLTFFGTPAVGVQASAPNDLQRNGAKLKRLMGVPVSKELWLEATTGALTVGSVDEGENHTYYYNPCTLKCSFERPNTANAVVRPEAECRKLLDSATPCTLIVTRAHRQITEQALRATFEPFGPIAFAKVFRIKELSRVQQSANPQRRLAYFRMETIQSQKKILDQVDFTIDGREVKVRVPSNRIFISRVPDGVQLVDLHKFFFEEIKKFDDRGYCIDVYNALPFRQFAFCTVGGQQIAPRLAIKADYIFKGTSIGVTSCHSDTSLDVTQLIDDKIKELLARSDFTRVRSLQGIATEVKSLVQVLAKMRKFRVQMNLLMQINMEFMKCSEEKLRNYLCVQDHVFEICKAVAMDVEGDDQLKKKRARPENAEENCEEGGASAQSEEKVDSAEQEEEEINDEDLEELVPNAEE